MLPSTRMRAELGLGAPGVAAELGLGVPSGSRGAKLRAGGSATAAWTFGEMVERLRAMHLIFVCCG